MLNSAIYSSLLLVALLAISSATSSDHSNVVSEEEWKQLLRSVQDGGILHLGERGVSFAGGKFQPSAPVTIKGGRFGPISLNQWSNVTFEGSEFKAPPGTVEYRSLIVANEPKNIKIIDCKFSGFMDEDGQLHARGVLLRNGTNVVIRGSMFTHMAGVNGFYRSRYVRFEDNTMDSVREGIQVQGGDHIAIKNNRFTNLRPFKGDHTDAIQFFTTGLRNAGDTATSDVEISGNLIVAANSSQGIFMRDELGLAAQGRGYKRVAIEGNLIIGAVWHGITAVPVDGLVIRKNQALRLAGRDVRGNRIAADGWNVSVEDNEADAYILGSSVAKRGNRKRGPMSASQIDAAIHDWTNARYVR